MANAIQQVEEEREAPAEEKNQPEPGAPERLGQRKGIVAPGGGDQPPDQERRTDGERETGATMEDREYGSELRPVNLQMRRKRPFEGRHSVRP